jgi:hypothetical protein
VESLVSRGRVAHLDAQDIGAFDSHHERWERDREPGDAARLSLVLTVSLK